MSKIRRRTAAAIAATTLVGPLAALDARPAYADQVITVPTRADDGSATSLRAVIDLVNAGPAQRWTIVLLAGDPYVIDRQCQHGNLDDNHGGDLDLTTNDDVELVGRGVEPATIEVRCAGERVLHHSGAARLTPRNIRLTGGNTANGAPGDQGGDRDGRRAADGGAILSSATVELDHSVLEGNRTGNGGNGTPVLLGVGNGGEGGDGGSGAAVSAVSIHMRSTRVVGDVSGRGGNGANGVGAGNRGGHGGSGGAGAVTGLGAELSRSAVLDNVAGDGGLGGHGLGAVASGGRGGPGGEGGGVAAGGGEMIASTIAGNRTGSGARGGNGNGAPAGQGGDARRWRLRRRVRPERRAVDHPRERRGCGRRARHRRRAPRGTGDRHLTGGAGEVGGRDRRAGSAGEPIPPAGASALTQ